MVVLLVGCGPTKPREATTDYKGIYPVIICPDGDVGIPSMKTGYTQWYMCF